MMEATTENGIVPSIIPTDQNFTMFPRVWTQSQSAAQDGADHRGAGTRFTVTTYNILTDLCVPKNQYMYCPEQCRYMLNRHPRILVELKTMNSDVFCLQEVAKDHWEGSLQPDMATLGYKGVYFVPGNGQGLAVFYKESVFTLLEEEHYHAHELADAYIQAAPIGSDLKEEIKQSIQRHVITILVKLQHVSGDVICVANIHVSWDGLKFPALQALQISSTVNKLVKFAGGADKPHIICGDFNTPPSFPAYHMLTNSRLTPETKSILTTMTENLNEKEKLIGKDITELLPEAFCLHTHFNSAYKTVLGREPAVTNCDDCELPERTNLCLDYFWFSHQSLEASAVLETPPPEAITRHWAMPSVLFPSDHLPIQAEFVFKH